MATVLISNLNKLFNFVFKILNVLDKSFIRNKENKWFECNDNLVEECFSLENTVGVIVNYLTLIILYTR